MSSAKRPFRCCQELGPRRSCGRGYAGACVGRTAAANGVRIGVAAIAQPRGWGAAGSAAGSVATEATAAATTSSIGRPAPAAKARALPALALAGRSLPR